MYLKSEHPSSPTDSPSRARSSMVKRTVEGAWRLSDKQGLRIPVPLFTSKRGADTGDSTVCFTFRPWATLRPAGDGSRCRRASAYHAEGCGFDSRRAYSRGLERSRFLRGRQ